MEERLIAFVIWAIMRIIYRNGHLFEFQESKTFRILMLRVRR